MRTLCTLLCYRYKQTYFKVIFLNKRESQNTKQMKSGVKGDWELFFQAN